MKLLPTLVIVITIACQSSFAAKFIGPLTKEAATLQDPDFLKKTKEYKKNKQ